MSRKTEACYTHLFENIKKNIFNLDANSFMTDYELAMRSAIRKIFPNASVFACWFHLCQAVKRKANAIPGFVQSLRSDKGAMEIYGKYLCLPLLPAPQITQAFGTLKAESEIYDAALFRPFNKYYEKQWINKVRQCATCRN